MLARKFLPYADGAQTILDFGCGDAAILATLPARRRLAVEPNAASRAAHDRASVESFARLRDLPDGCADLAISNHALEHCRHPLQELVDIRRTLRADGSFVLIVPVDDWRVQRRYDPHDRHHHLYTWTPRILGNLLAEAGFGVRRVAMVRHAWPPGVYYVSRLPAPLFDIICRLWSRLTSTAELIAVCTASP